MTIKKFMVELTKDGATSPIDTIVVREDYTAEDYIKDCEANADEDWIEMLANGTVSLVECDDVKKLMRVETNAYWMLVTYDPYTRQVRWLIEDNNNDIKSISLDDVTDDSTWECENDVVDIDLWLGDAEIVDEMPVR